jgi:hypothetical protein
VSALNFLNWITILCLCERTALFLGLLYERVKGHGVCNLFSIDLEMIINRMSVWRENIREGEKRK